MQSVRRLLREQPEAVLIATPISATVGLITLTLGGYAASARVGLRKKHLQAAGAAQHGWFGTGSPGRSATGSNVAPRVPSPWGRA